MKSGYTHDIGTKCHDIGSSSFPMSHTMMSLVPSRPRAQGWGWLSGCRCCLLVIARESFIQCNELYLFFPAAAAAPAEPGAVAPAAAAAAPPAAVTVVGSKAVVSCKSLVVHNVQFCKPLVVLA